MSLIKIVLPFSPGITLGIGVIIKLIRENRDNLLNILHLYRSNEQGDSTFIAFFKEPNSICEITAVMNVWGTTFGYSGEGHRGYGAIRSVIEDLELPFEQEEWYEFSQAKTNLLGDDWSDDDSDCLEYLKKWEELLIKKCYVSLCAYLPREMYTWDHFNAHWKLQNDLSQVKRNPSDSI